MEIQGTIVVGLLPHDSLVEILTAVLQEVTDFRGMTFQDEPWWPEAVALARKLGVGPQ